MTNITEYSVIIWQLSGAIRQPRQEKGCTIPIFDNAFTQVLYTTCTKTFFPVSKIFKINSVFGKLLASKTYCLFGVFVTMENPLWMLLMLHISFRLPAEATNEDATHITYKTEFCPQTESVQLFHPLKLHQPQSHNNKLVKKKPHLNLAPRLRMSGAVPPFPLYTFTPFTGTTLPFHCS
jgi:hypothetical protein